MKKVAISLVLLFLACACFANDTLVQKNTGGNDYIIGEAKDIIIESEILQIDLFDDYYHVSVDYVFRNEGAEAVLEVGFPEIEYYKTTDDVTPVILDDPKRLKLSNFKTSVNGVNQKVEIEDADIYIKPKVHSKESWENIRHFYKKTVTFPAKQKTNIHVEYDTSYGSSYWFHIADYLLGSAICWGGIENLKVIAVLNSTNSFLAFPSNNFSYCMKENTPVDIHVETENELRKLILSYKDLNLELGTKLKFATDRTSSGIFGLPWDYTFNVCVYPRAMFEMLTKEQLRLSRNMVFAFHGYKFKDKKLEERFKEFWFYKDDAKSFSESSFNDKERANLELIMSVEKEKL